MLSLPLLAAFQLAASAPPPRVYDGRAGQTTVAIPKFEADIAVDGNLDEPVWRRAAVLTGFSLYSPVDQRPAPDSTEVLVWYSSNAIYFGIRAFEPHGAVTATLADRDRIAADDNIEIHLATSTSATARSSFSSTRSASRRTASRTRQAASSLART